MFVGALTASLRMRGLETETAVGRRLAAVRLARGTRNVWSGAVKLLLHLRRYRLPLRAAVRTAHGVLTEREGVIVRLEDQSGCCGFGEAAPVPGFGGGSVDEIESALRGLGGADESTGARRVTGVELDDFCRAAPDRLACAAVALESALIGLAERGGDGDPALPSRATSENSGLDTLSVAALLPAGKAALPRLGPLGDAGFRTFKWKVGVAAAEEELPLLDDLCAELPKGARVRLDANGAWDRRTAERWLERCAERPVEYVEQPCADGAWAGASGRARAEDLLRGLAEDFPTPIALDESLVGGGDVDRWLAAEWRGVWVIKPGLLGHAEVVLARLARARADVVFSSALETAVGARAALRLAFAWAAAQPGAQRSTSNIQHSTSKGQTAGETRAEATCETQNAKPEIRVPRALGFGVWPLFQDARFDGPSLTPFLRAEDVERIDPEAVWNALS